jgi:hypothetical protein
LVGQAPAIDRFGISIAGSEFRVGGETPVPDSLQRQGLADQDLALRLDIIIEVHHVIVRIDALERQDIGVLAVDLDARR